MLSSARCWKNPAIRVDLITNGNIKLRLISQISVVTMGKFSAGAPNVITVKVNGLPPTTPKLMWTIFATSAAAPTQVNVSLAMAPHAIAALTPLDHTTTNQAFTTPLLTSPRKISATWLTRLALI